MCIEKKASRYIIWPYKSLFDVHASCEAYRSIGSGDKDELDDLGDKQVNPVCVSFPTCVLAWI